MSSESLHGGLKAYSLTDHIHEREAGRHLSTLLPSGSNLKVAFVPAVAPWFSGIQSVLSMPLNGKLTARNVRELYEEKYEGEKLIKILKGVPGLTDYENKHGWVVGGFQVHSEGDRAVVVVSPSCSQFPIKSTNFYLKGGLDNLLKGAATQCLQNLNLALGYDEYAGIPLD